MRNQVVKSRLVIDDILNFSDKTIIFGTEKGGISSLFVNFVEVFTTNQQNGLRDVLSWVNTF